MNKIFLVFLLIAAEVQEHVSVYGWEARVEVWEDCWPTGPCSSYRDLSSVSTPDDGSGNRCWIPYSHYGISGIKFTSGSCARLHTNADCTSLTTVTRVYKNFGSCAYVGEGWNDETRAIGYCSVTSMTKSCPTGSFVRRLYVPGDDLVSGITMHCFSPSSSFSDAPTALINSVGATPQTSTNRDCSYPWGARGVSLDYQSTFQFVYSSQSSNELICGQGSSTSDTVCGQNQVLTGFTSEVEEISGVTKSLKAICMDVKDPTLTCGATEFSELVTIGTCDNLGGATDKTCTISIKLGWGEPDPDQFSEAERNQKAFYTAYFPQALTARNLLSRFRIIGNSKIEGVKFNWAEHGTRSWSPIQTKSVSVTTPPATISTFQQLKGKCGFYGVHTSYVKRIDRTGSQRTETNYRSGFM